MNILQKNIVTIGRMQHFLALAELNNEYCFFESQHTLLSNFGVWLTRRPDAIMRDSNENLRWYDKERVASILQDRIFIEQNIELKNELQKFALAIDESKKLTAKKTRV